MLTDGQKRCSCDAGCPNWGTCMRRKGIGLGNLRGTGPAHERELREYREARRQGIQPKGTQLAQTRQAVDESNRTGRAFKP